MKVSDVPSGTGFRRVDVAMRDLLRRADGPSQASWLDLPESPGIYIVYWVDAIHPTFASSAGKAIWATCTHPESLDQRWKRICQASATDILYIGKGDDLRRRIRLLARFGVGKADNHTGGEWLWQVQAVEASRILVQTCPFGKQKGFENWLLDRFYDEHGDYPLANRKGPEGMDRWFPQPATDQP